MDDFDPHVGPVSVNGGASEPEPSTLGLAIFPVVAWAAAIYDVVVGVNYGAVVNAAGLTAVYLKAIAIE